MLTSLKMYLISNIFQATIDQRLFVQEKSEK